MNVVYQDKHRHRHSKTGVADVDDRCNECSELAVQSVCNKCGEGVCMSSTCCELFPYYNNSNYTICRKCTNTISDKLQVLLNYNELRLLKQKISKKMEKKIEQLKEHEE